MSIVIKKMKSFLLAYNRSQRNKLLKAPSKMSDSQLIDYFKKNVNSKIEKGIKEHTATFTHKKNKFTSSYKIKVVKPRSKTTKKPTKTKTNYIIKTESKPKPKPKKKITKSKPPPLPKLPPKAPPVPAKKRKTKKKPPPVPPKPKKKIVIPKEHKKQHTKKHITTMKKEMKKGKTFKQAHKIAVKKDKKIIKKKVKKIKKVKKEPHLDKQIAKERAMGIKLLDRERLKIFKNKLGDSLAGFSTKIKKDAEYAGDEEFMKTVYYNLLVEPKKSLIGRKIRKDYSELTISDQRKFFKKLKKFVTTPPMYITLEKGRFEAKTMSRIQLLRQAIRQKENYKNVKTYDEGLRYLVIENLEEFITQIKRDNRYELKRKVKQDKKSVKARLKSKAKRRAIKTDEKIPMIEYDVNKNLTKFLSSDYDPLFWLTQYIHEIDHYFDNKKEFDAGNSIYEKEDIDEEYKDLKNIPYQLSKLLIMFRYENGNDYVKLTEKMFYEIYNKKYKSKFEALVKDEKNWPNLVKRYNKTKKDYEDNKNKIYDKRREKDLNRFFPIFEKLEKEGGKRKVEQYVNTNPFDIQPFYELYLNSNNVKEWKASLKKKK